MQIPNLATTREIQTNYRATFNKAKSSGPVVIMTNNKPDVVILSIPDAVQLYKKARATELAEALAAVKAYQKAKKSQKMVTATSLADL